MKREAVVTLSPGDHFGEIALLRDFLAAVGAHGGSTRATDSLTRTRLAGLRAVQA